MSSASYHMYRRLKSNQNMEYVRASFFGYSASDIRYMVRRFCKKYKLKIPKAAGLVNKKSKA